MAKWWEPFVVDISRGDVEELLVEKIEKDQVSFLADNILEKATLIRQAFSTIKNSSANNLSHDIPEKAVISRTQFGKVRGRPKTAQWAYWTSFVIQQELKIEGKPPTYNFLADLCSILLGSETLAQKLRSEFVGLRRTVERNAQLAAQDLLDTELRSEMSARQYERDLLNVIGKDYQGWVKNVSEKRKTILRNVNKNGLLGGQKPRLLISSYTAITGIEFNPQKLSFSVHSDSDGLVHLGKSLDVPVKPPTLHRENSTGGSMSVSRSEKNEVDVNIGFPTHLLDERDPYITALFAVPPWWQEWRAIFTPPIFTES